MKKITLFLFIASALGCNGFAFNTNVAPYAKEQVKSIIVKEYTLEEIARYDAVPLGFVEASYCQEKVYQRKPSKNILLNDLKRSAHSLGANGVVVEACGGTRHGICQDYIECRGMAYSVPERQSRP